MESIKHRTQISLEDWQYQALLDLSRKTKKSLSGIIREMITDRFSKSASEQAKDPVFDLIGIGRGDGSSVARRHDMYLYGRKK